MNDKIILDTVIKEKQNYTAIFDRYTTSDSGNVFLHFVNVRDEEGKLIKESFFVQSSDVIKLVGQLLPEQVLSFSAQVIEREDLIDGFDFTNVAFLNFDGKM